MQKFFFDNLNSLLPGAKRIKKKSDPLHVPDGWILHHGFECPVEVKRRNFDQSALDQLKRYMRVYGSTHGIAVSRKLTVKLPPNIQYIACVISRKKASQGKS